MKSGIRSSQRAPTALTMLQCVRLCAGATSIDLRHEGLSVKFARVSRAVPETAITTPMLHLPAFQQGHAVVSSCVIAISQTHQTLKRFLLIFSDRIFDSNVDRGIPNFAAAPLGPNIRPRLSFRA